MSVNSFTMRNIRSRSRYSCPFICTFPVDILLGEREKEGGNERELYPVGGPTRLSYWAWAHSVLQTQSHLVSPDLSILNGTPQEIHSFFRQRRLQRFRKKFCLNSDPQKTNFRVEVGPCSFSGDPGRRFEETV